MKYLDSIKRAGRSLRNAKGRTILTSMAIGVGAFTITLAVAAGLGSRDFVDEFLTSNINPNAVNVFKESDVTTGPFGGESISEYDPDTAGEAQTEIGEFTLSQEQVDTIAGLDGVAETYIEYMVQPNYIQLEGGDERLVVSTATHDPDISLSEVAGDLPEKGTAINDDEVIISKDLADQLGGADAAVDLQLLINVTNPVSGQSQDFRYDVVAVFEPSSLALSFGEMYISAAGGREMSSFINQGTEMEGRYYGIVAIADDTSTPDDVKTAIQDIDDSLAVQTAEELTGSLFTIVNIIMGIVVGFGVIALIAAVFGIINTQYISVLERTREIGLMKALGMRGRHVRRLFQLEAAWIGVLGGLIGAGLAWLAGLFLNPWIAELTGLDNINLLVFNPLAILGLIVLLAIIAMLAGWFPSRKASSLDPIEALRTE